MNNLFKIFCCIVLVLQQTSCKSKETATSLPVPREKVKAILMDLYLAASAAELHPSSNKDSLQQIYLTEICKIHSVTPEIINECNRVLQSDMKLNADLQKEVLDSLNVIQLKPVKRFR